MHPNHAPRREAVPRGGDRATLERFRGVLEASGYTEAGLRGILRLPPGADLVASDTHVHALRLPSGEPLSTLVRLFGLSLPVGAAEAARALAPLEIAALQAVRLVDVEDDRIRGTVCIFPFEGLWVAADRHDRGETAEYVMGVFGASKHLARLTVRQPVSLALDLGTGSGVLALLAARHADRVIATDINHRALAFAEFNADFNDLPNIECRPGSGFEPVSDDRFDLVVSDPPFVISPDATYLYRDADDPGDTFARGIVRGASRVLADGGFAHVICDWIERPGDPWWAPLHAWLEGTGCDAWLLRHSSNDPPLYAARWNASLRDTDPRAYVEAVERWARHYRRWGINAISSGVIILRRRGAADNWIKSADLRSMPAASAAEHVLRLFNAQDTLERSRDPDTLLDERLSLAQTHRIDRALTYRGGRAVAERAVVRLEAGAGVLGEVDPHALPVLLRMHGRTLRDAVEHASRDEGCAFDEMLARAMPSVRRLFELGLLEWGEQAVKGRSTDTGSHRRN